jgi:hypothetical protein
MQAKVTISFIMDIEDEDEIDETFTLQNYVEEVLEDEGVYFLEDMDYVVIDVEEVK